MALNNTVLDWNSLAKDTPTPEPWELWSIKNPTHAFKFVIKETITDDDITELKAKSPKAGEIYDAVYDDFSSILHLDNAAKRVAYHAADEFIKIENPNILEKLQYFLKATVAVISKDGFFETLKNPSNIVKAANEIAKYDYSNNLALTLQQKLQFPEDKINDVKNAIFNKAMNIDDSNSNLSSTNSVASNDVLNQKVTLGNADIYSNKFTSAISYGTAVGATNMYESQQGNPDLVSEAIRHQREYLTNDEILAHLKHPESPVYKDFLNKVSGDLVKLEDKSPSEANKIAKEKIANLNNPSNYAATSSNPVSRAYYAFVNPFTSSRINHDEMKFKRGNIKINDFMKTTVYQNPEQYSNIIDEIPKSVTHLTLAEFLEDYKSNSANTMAMNKEEAKNIYNMHKRTNGEFNNNEVTNMERPETEQISQYTQSLNPDDTKYLEHNEDLSSHHINNVRTYYTVGELNDNQTLWQAVNKHYDGQKSFDPNAQDNSTTEIARVDFDVLGITPEQSAKISMTQETQNYLTKPTIAELEEIVSSDNVYLINALADNYQTANNQSPTDNTNQNKNIVKTIISSAIKDNPAAKDNKTRYTTNIAMPSQQQIQQTMAKLNKSKEFKIAGYDNNKAKGNVSKTQIAARNAAKAAKQAVAETQKGSSGATGSWGKTAADVTTNDKPPKKTNTQQTAITKNGLMASGGTGV